MLANSKQVLFYFIFLCIARDLHPVLLVYILLYKRQQTAFCHESTVNQNIADEMLHTDA